MNHDDAPAYWRSMPRSGWLHDAACAGMPRAWWFESATPREEQQARDVCAKCPVCDDCLAFGLRAEPSGGRQYRHGIFGGMNGIERERFSKLVVL